MTIDRKEVGERQEDKDQPQIPDVGVRIPEKTPFPDTHLRVSSGEQITPARELMSSPGKRGVKREEKRD